jgi:hypothetical protein
MTKKQQIKNFIENNGIDFNTTGSSLNSNCTILSGYALYIGITSPKMLIKYIDPPDSETEDEIERVFKYAKGKNYENWWVDEKNRNKFKL